MTSIERRLDAIEKKVGTQKGPIVVVHEGDEIPEGTPPNAIILWERYEDDPRHDES